MYSKVCIILIAFWSVALSVCPPKESLSPCTCFNDNIYCQGKEDLDLLKVFERLSENTTQKHFYELNVNNAKIKELEENCLKGFTFEVIWIYDCPELTTINRNAFNETTLVTKDLQIYGNPKLSSPDNSIFEVLSKFKRVEYIYLGQSNITEIPSEAFKPVNGNQDHLINIHINSTSLAKIGERAFFHLNSLNFIQISNTNIQTIPANAFAFEKVSNQSLTIRFYSDQFLDKYNFAKDAFTQIKRPVTLDMSNKEAFLDERVFLPFLLENSKNAIISDHLFDCDDCRNFWLRKNSTLQTRIKNLKCLNKKNFNDSSNFKNCPSLFQFE